jgi:cysteine desulfurase / selenocysteine lyase
VTTPLPRREFPITQRYVYLNHAAVGVLPESTRQALAEFVDAHAGAGALGTAPYEARMPEYRERIGAFVGAAGEEIAIVPNTSAGANVVALGLDWKPGDRVLFCDNEFPANAYAWLALRERGVDVQLLETDRERLTPDVLRREITARTRVVAVSWVSYADGYRHDLAALAEVAHASGALLAVDAIQGLGAFPLDVRTDGIDVLYAGAAKWLLGLQGVGFLYVRADLIDQLRLPAPGWRSVVDMWDFLNYDQPFSQEALRFEGGTPSFLGTLSMVRSIDLLARATPAAIGAHLLALTDRLAEGLVRAGARLSTLRGPGISSGIVSFSMPGCDSVALGRALQEEGIVTTWRPTGIRAAPHGYNTFEEIDHLAALVPQYARTLATNG